MEYQTNRVERRHTEVYTRFRNFRIDNLEDDQAFSFILVAMLGCDWCSSRCCTWYQRGSWPFVSIRKNGYLGFKWSCVSIMWLCLLLKILCCWNLFQIWSKASLQLFLLCIVKKEMKSTTIEKETEIDTQETFFFYSQQYILQGFEINHQLLRRHFWKKKMISPDDHRPEKNSDEYTESILWLYHFCDRIISGAKCVHICWITNLFVSTPNLSHSSVCCRLK